MRKNRFVTFSILAAASSALLLNSAFAGDPQLSSWFTKLQGRYASLYETVAKEGTRDSVTIWSHGQGYQLRPAYAGVYEIVHTATDVYVLSSGCLLYTSPSPRDA